MVFTQQTMFYTLHDLRNLISIYKHLKISRSSLAINHNVSKNENHKHSILNQYGKVLRWDLFW